MGYGSTGDTLRLAGVGGSSLIQALGPLALIVVAPAWIVGLLSMGVLQSRRLRPAVADAEMWIPVTTVTWSIGVAIPVIALSVVPNGWPPAVHVVVGVGAAVAMCAVVGFITGATRVRFTKQIETKQIETKQPVPERSGAPEAKHQ